MYLLSPRIVRAISLRIQIVEWGAYFVLFIIGFRLFTLAVLNNPIFREKAKAQVIRSVPLYPLRGEILDRNRVLLAGNRPSFRLLFYPDRVKDSKKTVAFLRSFFPGSASTLERKVKEAKRRIPYEVQILISELSEDDVSRLSPLLFSYPELEIQAIPQREYPYGVYGSHFLGHLGEIDKEEIEGWRPIRLYSPGDLVGKFGVEKVYEPYLSGEKGREEILVDAYGRRQEVIRTIPPRKGKDLILTIDIRLQEVAEKALGEERGVVLAMNPNNGEIYLYVSHPNFDPGLFLKGFSWEEWKDIFQNPDHPFENRPIRGLYPPGSTFKPFVALVALMEGKVRPKDTVFCPGYIRVGNKILRCWRKEGHGTVNLYRALVQSCDVYFYELGRRVGVSLLSKYASLFGFGNTVGIDLPGEKRGIFPSEEWKRKILKEPWYPAETPILAIGQGYLTVTPLQLMTFYATLLNGGYKVRPHLYKEVSSEDPPYPSGETIWVLEKIPVRSEYIQEVLSGLKGVVQEPFGTGRGAFIPGYSVGGKTGTAQVVRMKEGVPQEHLPKEFRDHAWFVGFAPVEKPEIVVLALVEHGGMGGRVAVPIVREVLKAYFQYYGEKNI